MFNFLRNYQTFLKWLHHITVLSAINVGSNFSTSLPIFMSVSFILGFPGGSDGKESVCNVGDLGLIPVLGRPPGEGNGNPFQYSCLENPIDGGAWRATVHGGCKELDKTEQLHSLTFILVILVGV